MEEMPLFSPHEEHQIPPKKLVDAFIKLQLAAWERISQNERISLLKSMAEEHIPALLVGMSREQRAALMNGLLPLISQEFPLADLDLLEAYPTPKKLYVEKQNDQD